jgi:hypothetical protein
MAIVIILDDERDIETHRTVFDLNLLKIIHKGAEVVYARTYEEFTRRFIKAIEMNIPISAISFDHDIQDFWFAHDGKKMERTGYHCVSFMRDRLYRHDKICKHFLDNDTKFFVHSQNSVGAKAINDCINYDILRFLHRSFQ